VTYGREEKRPMKTGMYVVKDIACKSCGTNVGWTYVTAEEESEKFKEGKFILETQVLKVIT
jgi:uncharacterized protein CbrC (UPF0167 family)